MAKNNPFVLMFLSALLLIFIAPEASAQTTESLDYRERFALRSVRTLHGAEMTYQATAGAGAYGTLENLRAANFIDPVLASGEKHGYVYVLTLTPATATQPARFRLTATPKSYPKSGRRSFFIDEYGELRGADKGGAPADPADPVIATCAATGVFSNERCVIGEARSFHGAQTTYQATTGAGAFGSFAQLLAAGLIHSSLASGSRHGYVLSLVTTAPGAGTPAFFSLRATPLNYGGTTVRSFYIDVDGIVRGGDKQGQPADENDPPIPD